MWKWLARLLLGGGGFIGALDGISRLQTVISLRPLIGFLDHPLAPVLALVAGFTILTLEGRRSNDEGKKNVAIHDPSGVPYKPDPKRSSLWAVSASLVIGVVAGLLLWCGWALRWSPVPLLPNAGTLDGKPLIAAAIRKEVAAIPVKVPTQRQRVKTEPRSEAEHPAKPMIGDDNTLVNVPTPTSMGSGNTIIGATDSGGNTRITTGGTAIGKGACADSTSVAIGAGANAGSCKDSKAAEKK